VQLNNSEYTSCPKLSHPALSVTSVFL